MSVSVARGNRGGSALNYTFGLNKALPFFRQNGVVPPAAGHISGDASQSKTPGLFSRILSNAGAKGSDAGASMTLQYGYRSFNIAPSGAQDTFVYEPSIASSKSTRSWADSDSSYSFSPRRRRSTLFGHAERAEDDDDDDDTASVDSEEARRDPREVVPVDLPALIAPYHAGIVTVPLPPPSADSSDSSDSDATTRPPARARTPFPTPRAPERCASTSAAPPGLVAPAPASSLPATYVPAPPGSRAARSNSYPPAAPTTTYASTASTSYAPAPAASLPASYTPAPRERRTSSSTPPSVPVRAATYPPRQRRASVTESTPASVPTLAPDAAAFSPPPPPPPPVPQQLPLEGLVSPIPPRPLSRANSVPRPLPSIPRAPSPSLSPVSPARPRAPGPAPRGVRWCDDLICPSPVPRARRRRGWFNRRGDQLWTNEGAYRPAPAGGEFPRDLRHYPAPGTGWMNEEGLRIDMGHRLVKGPFKSALKKGAGGGGRTRSV
ncbi:hypothetical protein K488DRAFT_90888 [Vararia minispora EC-137]|uniref:Uncharacterized protein n=1 Tax=Vararia minispora EC-137 TaxID=1314806 RepID=A0ACB8Q894_9AGAM|nr:hypothetical protein K488DRAFT_90888 [Vararia minispora EC-137]